jgi:ATP-dependent DNA ligase
MVRAAKQSANLAAKRTARDPLPTFIEPQLSKLVEHAPTGPNWVHEVKYDGYRMAARIEGDRVKLQTRSGLDWSEKYPETVQALSKLSLETDYIDGELCGVGADGVTSFPLMQTAVDQTATGSLSTLAFHRDGRRAQPHCRRRFGGRSL